MTPIQQAQNAYRDTSGPIRTERDTEYDIIARATSRLKRAAARGRDGFGELAEALHDNRRLWTLLAADVAANDNALPRDLRARILYLSEFTRQHSSKVLRNRASVAPLIEINTAVLRGLREGARRK